MHGEVTAEGCNQSNDVPLNSHSHSHSRVGRAGKKRRGTECRWTGLNWTRLILTTVILCLPACSHHHHRDHLLPYCYPPTTCDRSTAPLDKTCCINSRKGGGAIRQRTVRSVAFHRTVCTVWWRRNEKEKKKQSKARQASKQAKHSTAQPNQGNHQAPHSK